MSVSLLVAEIMRGFEVTLFRRFQSAGSFFSRNGRDELSDPSHSGDCYRKNFIFVQDQGHWATPYSDALTNRNSK